MDTRKLVSLAAAIAAAGALALSLSSCAGFKEAQDKAKGIKAIEIADLDLAKVRDGSYEDYQDFGLDTAKVSVDVSGGKIAAIRILEHKHGPGKSHSGAPVADRVMAAQSLKVDVVSGATGSSKVVLKAIEQALRKGLD
jgi:uncharacterized protein with FMN-binding domain